MGKIFCMIGKSACGKDSLYRSVLERQPIPLSTVITYTTRPIRTGEHEGVEYHFTDIPRYRELLAAGLVIESRCYHTVLGDWYYYTVKDGQITDDRDYILITTLEGFVSLADIYGRDRVIPIYIEVEDGLRLERALTRERKGNKQYKEMCRRFVADSDDFSEENIARAGIIRRYENNDYNTCLDEICHSMASL